MWRAQCFGAKQKEDMTYQTQGNPHPANIPGAMNKTRSQGYSALWKSLQQYLLSMPLPCEIATKHRTCQQFRSQHAVIFKFYLDPDVNYLAFLPWVLQSNVVDLHAESPAYGCGFCKLLNLLKEYKLSKRRQILHVNTMTLSFILHCRTLEGHKNTSTLKKEWIKRSCINFW